MTDANYDAAFSHQIRDDDHLRKVAYLTKLHQQPVEQIATENPRECPGCGALIVPVKMPGYQGRVTVVWPERCANCAGHPAEGG